MRGSSTIGKAALVVSAGILLSRLLGWLRNSMILGLLGTTAEGDLYTNAFLIPDYLTFLLAGGYLSITLVPLLSRHLSDGEDTELLRTFTAVFRVVALAFLALAVVTMVGAGAIVDVVFPRVQDQDHLTSLTRIALASQVFFGMGTLLMAAQYAHRRFTLPALAPLIYNLGIILGGLVGWALGDPSPESFLIGGFIGAGIGNFGLQALGAHRLGYRLVRGTPWLHPAVRQYFALALPLMLGISAVALDEQWPKLFGQYADEGSTLALQSARYLNMVPVGVIAQTAGVAAYPFLAGLAAEGRVPELGATVLRSVRGAVAVGGLAAGLIAGLTVPIVAAAYPYGKGDESPVEVIAVLLLWYSLSIPFWPAHQVYSRGFYAMERMWTPVIVGSVVTAGLIPVLWALVNAYGAPGVAAGSTIGVAVYTVAIAVAWHRLVSPVELGSILGFAARIALLVAATAGASWGVSALLGEVGLPALIRLIGGSAVGAMVYLALARVVGIAEVLVAVDRVLARIRTLRGRSAPEPPSEASEAKLRA